MPGVCPAQQVKGLACSAIVTGCAYIAQADLLVDGSFVDAFQGCKYVFHTASPILMYCPSGKEYEILIKPAVEGTKNVVSELQGSS